MHTEDEARKLWCPKFLGGILWVSTESEPERNPAYSRCIASECCMWRWIYADYHVGRITTFDVDTGETRISGGEKEAPTHDYCGLAGKP